MIEYTVLDYEGEPVTIEDGEMLIADPPDYDFSWNSEDCEWEPDDIEGELGSESLEELEMRCWYQDRL